MPADEPWDAVARAVSARAGSLRVAAGTTGAEGNRFRHARWPATRPDVPYAVYLADPGGFRTLAFDIDRGGEAGGAQARRLTELLGSAGVRYVEAVSGPSGHRHVLTTWQTPVPARAAADLARALRSNVAPDLDLSALTNPRTGCIRPPGSPHRHGGRSRLHRTSITTAVQVLTEGNASAAFDRLAVIVGEPAAAAGGCHPGCRPGEPGRPNVTVLDATGQPRLAGERRPLSRSTRESLHRPLTRAEQDDRSAVAYRVMVAAAFARWSLTDLLPLVSDEAATCFDHLRRLRTADGFSPRRPHDVAARTERMWHAAVRYAAGQPPDTPPSQTTAARVQAALAAVDAAAAADRSSWAGQGGPGRRVVLEELLGLAHQLGSTTVARGVRDLELATGLGKSSVARALTGLRERGWLVREGALAAGPTGTPTSDARLRRRSATYQLRVPGDVPVVVGGPGAGGTLVPAPPVPLDPLGAPDGRPHADDPVHVRSGSFLLGAGARSHDACTREGLGRHAGLLLDLLAVDAFGTAELADRAFLSPRTVRRHLGRLVALGLARRGPRGVWLADPSGLGAAAEHLGVAGVVTQRREQSRVEREAWAWWLADFHAERGWATARGLRAAGRHTTSTGAPCPGSRFPLHAGARRSWRAGTDGVRAGLGLTTPQLHALDPDGRLLPAIPVPLKPVRCTPGDRVLLHAVRATILGLGAAGQPQHGERRRCTRRNRHSTPTTAKTPHRPDDQPCTWRPRCREKSRLLLGPANALEEGAATVPARRCSRVSPPEWCPGTQSLS